MPGNCSSPVFSPHETDQDNAIRNFNYGLLRLLLVNKGLSPDKHIQLRPVVDDRNQIIECRKAEWVESLINAYQIPNIDVTTIPDPMTCDCMGIPCLGYDFGSVSESSSAP